MVLGRVHVIKRGLRVPQHVDFDWFANVVFFWMAQHEGGGVSVKFTQRDIMERQRVQTKKSDASCDSRELIPQRGTHVAARHQVSLKVT